MTKRRDIWWLCHLVQDAFKEGYRAGYYARSGNPPTLGSDFTAWFESNAAAKLRYYDENRSPESDDNQGGSSSEKSG